MDASRNWNLPSRREAWLRLQEARPPAWVPRHGRAVEALAAAMAHAAARADLAVDRDLVMVGALLHDVGRSITQDVRHAHLGADLLRDDGWPSAVIDIVERHTGAGIPAAEADALGLPPRDYMPRSLEQRIVAHADNLHAGDRRIAMAELERKYRGRGLDAAWQRIDRLHAELERELACDLDALEPASLPDPTNGS